MRENAHNLECRTTVVIPNYNGIQYIENCLKSLYAGRCRPVVIVVDNGSGDESRRLVKEKFPQVKLISLEENTGFCHAVNVGIREADTEFVFLLNNDTTVEEGCVEELEKALSVSENIFSAGAKMINMRFPEKIDDAGDFYCALGWAFARGKDQPAENMKGAAGFSLPAPGRPCTDGRRFWSWECLTRRISPIWRILTWATGPILWGFGMCLRRRPW